MARCSQKWLETRIGLYNKISGDNLKIHSMNGRYSVVETDPNTGGIDSISPWDKCDAADSVITTLIRMAEKKKIKKE